MNPLFSRLCPGRGRVIIHIFYVILEKLQPRRVEVLISPPGSGLSRAMAHQNQGLQMLTANRLRDGGVLYRKGDGWTLSMGDGDVYRDQASADAALAAATAELARNTFVAPYLFEVREVNGHIRPVKEREIIRAAGPSVGTGSGGQAAGKTDV
jgi:sulfite reductase (NADPH) hemoprotein beta-component